MGTSELYFNVLEVKDFGACCVTIQATTVTNGLILLFTEAKTG